MGFLVWIAYRSNFSKSDKVDKYFECFLFHIFRNLDSPRNEYSFQRLPGTNETLIVRIIKCWEGLIKYSFGFSPFINLVCNFRAHKLWFKFWSRITWFRILSSGRFVFWITKKSWAKISWTWQTSKNKSSSEAGLYSMCFYYTRTTLS